jgi:hypothetical protein
MKNYLKKIITVFTLTLAITFTSCSTDDDNSNSNSSKFILDRENLKGEINEGIVTLESGVFKLTGKLLVKENAKLIIKPGVTIEATDATSDGIVRYIAVAQGGKIDIQGTSLNPVVMTSTNKIPGSWGGLVLCGKAPINKGLTASAEVSELTYGGNNVNDSSGSIQYLRLEYTGYAYNNEKEFNGLSLFGVGKGTIIEFVQVYESSDDGFEWFGGTVDAKYLVVVNKHEQVGDDLFDWTEGWNGTGENWFAIRTNAGNRGIEADNSSNNHLATPISFPTIKNLTLIGPGGTTDTSSESQAFKLRHGTKGLFDNVVIKGWKTGIDIQHDESLSYLGTDLKITRIKFEDVATKSKGTNTSSLTVDVTTVFSEDNTATGAGNGTSTPTWTNNWTLGL